MKPKRLIFLIVVAVVAFRLGSVWKLKGIESLAGGKEPAAESGESRDSFLAEKVLPNIGIELPIEWKDLGKRLVSAGVIDRVKFEEIYARRGGMDEAARDWLTGAGGEKMVMTQANSGVILNLLWALGLGNKNPILEKGPMTDKQYGGAGNFAATAGWTAGRGQAMDHFAKHQFVVLNDQQQKTVERAAKNIYRPCCGNSTHFPDCNHGMAMLGLLELMAGAGVSEEEMYRTALQVNAYWFPQNYVNIAKYMQKQGVDWNKVEPKEILGDAYSSAAGYGRVLSQIEPAKVNSGGGCGV